MNFFNKKKNNQKMLCMIACAVLFSFYYILANQFVVVKSKQKKGAPTRSRLQELSCQHMSGILKRQSCLLRHIATVQDCCLKQVADFLEGASDSVLISVDKEKLKKIESTLEELNQYLEAVDGEIAKKMDSLAVLLKNRENKKI